MGEGRGGDISATLYVGHNLPESITKDHILQHFKTFVPDIDVLKSTVITNKAGKRHCKLVFTNNVAAEQAISQMNGTQIRGFKLHVNRWGPKKKESGTDSLIQFLEKAEPQHVNADDDDDSSDDSQSDISSVSIGSSLVCETEGSFRAYVGSNLPDRIQESTLKQHFQSSGYTVKYACIKTSKKNDTRFAIMALSSQEALDEAIKQLNGGKLLGYKLKMSPWVGTGAARIKHTGSTHRREGRQCPKEQGKRPPAAGNQPTDPLIQFLENAEPQHVQADDDDSSDDSQSDISSVSIGSSLVCETESSFRAYVGSNLPVRIQESTLKQHFQSLGYEVRSVQVITTKQKQTRFAIVTLPSQRQLDEAVKQVSGTKLAGYTLTVSPKMKRKGSSHKQGQGQRPKQQGKRPSAAGNQSTDLCTVMLRGIPNTVDDSLLRPLCEAYGKLTRLEVNRNEGTAVVSYPSPEVAATASTYLNGMKCGGGTLSVVSSASKEPLYPGYIAHAPSLSRELSPSSIGPHQPRYSMPQQPLVQSSLPPLQGHPPTLQGHRSPFHDHGLPLQSYGHPPQGHGPPLQSYGPPLQGHGPPLQGHGPPLHGHGPPLQGHGPPLQGHGPPLQGHGPPLHGHGAPLQGYGPPLQGHGPPLHGHGAPLQGYGPPLQGHGPPLHGHATPLQGHVPPLHVHKPFLQGHGPQMQGHAPPLHGHGPPLHGHGPPSHDHGPPPHDHGPPLQGHGLPPQAYGTSTQVQDHSRLVFIKISNIHPSITDEDLKHILSVVPSAAVVFHATPGSKPNYAHVNCADPADVNRVMETLKGKKFNGMPVSVKPQKGKFIVPPTACAAPPVDMQAPVSVKVTRLPKSATEKQLRGLIRSIQGVSSVVLKTVPTQEHDYAYINCENGFAAEQVAQNLNGMQLLGSTIKATLQQSKKTKENEEVDAPGEDTAEEGQEMSQDLYDFFQHRFCKEIATFEASGGILQYSEGFISVQGPEAEVNAFYKNSIKPVKDGSQPLTADQWGQLMAAKKGGTTLFQELSSPFLHNPNLKLERRENPFTLVIVGFQEAVDAATSHFFSKMDTKMVVNRMKLFALAHLKPDLPDIIEADCAVSVNGFHPGSSELTLESDGGDLTRARMRLLGELDAVFVHKKRVSLASNLVCSAQRFIESRKAQVVMCVNDHGVLGLPSIKPASTSTDEQLQVTLCGMPRETVNNIHRKLCAKPTCETVKINASHFAALADASAENNIESMQQEYGVALSYKPDECQVVIQGYNEGDVTAVSHILHSSEQTACKTQALDCSKEEAIYLSHVLFKKPIDEGDELLAALKADYSTTVIEKSSRILVVGPASTLDSAARAIKECALLTRLQKKSFHYNWCNSALLPDLKSKVHSLEDSQELVAFMSARQHQDKRASNVDITLLGSIVESFEAACQELQGIKPTSKKRDFEEAELRQLKRDFVQQLESAHPVHIHVSRPKKFIIVQSLWPAAVSHAFSKISDLFCETVRVDTRVPVSVTQLHFLREKRSSALDDDANQVSLGYPEDYVLKRKEASDLVYVSISGLRHSVESAVRSINEMLNGFECKEEVMDLDSEYQWTREWQKATKFAIEAECDILVEFPPHTSPSSSDAKSGKRGSTSAEKYTMAIRFAYVHENALQHARVILTECTTLSTHSVEVERAQQVEILKALKEKKLSCSGTLTSIQLKKAEGVVHVISPQRFPDGVGEMEERLMQYIRKEVSSSAEVPLEPPLSVLIQNKHFKDLKKGKGVFFKFTPNAVSLSGKTADVEAAKEKLKMLLSQLESSISTQTVTVPKGLQFAISSKEVRSVLFRFEKIHSVHISIPKNTGIRNELKWEAKIHPEGWSMPCAVQLVHGSLTKENTDAIVNAANANLELLGGVADSILKAGGSEIQDECTKYIALHGQVNVGDAVCLGSGKLSCKKVIHAVGPRWQGGVSGEDRELEATFLRTLEVAVQNGCLSIALPAIGTGVFHVPVQRCAWSAVNALTYFVSVHPDKLSTVKFVLFREADVPLFQEAFQALLSDTSFKTILTQSSLTSSTTAAGVESVPVWMWEDDSGVYQTCTSSHSAQLEQQFAISPSGSFQLQRDKWSYIVNLGAMTQMNMSTHKVRKLWRDTLSLSSQWYWQDDNGHMQPYSPSESTAIETIRRRHGAGNSLTINGQNYMFDFDKKVEVNSTTGHRRRIEYRTGQQSAAAASTSRERASAHSLVLSNPSRVSPSSVVITVKGCKEDVQAAAGKIEEHMKELCGSEVLPFPKKYAQKMERCLEDVSARLHVQVHFTDAADPGNRAANLTGWKVSVGKVMEEGRKTLIELMQTEIKEDVNRPLQWEGDDSSTALSLKEVTSSSYEFTKVLSLMQRTLPNARITKLERIQNEWLWTRYSQHRELIKKKNQGIAHELDLFHGTRNNPPDRIYTGEEGFDMRFSAQGMWGMGNYFAVNASYSHAYAHISASGFRQMFLVKVVVGASYDCPSNPSLRMPPEKQSKTTSMFGVERYDSVSGITKGSKVYIIYDNLKAYPFYLITYTA